MACEKPFFVCQAGRAWRAKGVIEMKNQPGLDEQTTFLLAPPEAEVVQEIVTRKRIALVAHDNKKNDLLEWARYNRDLLVQHELYATGTSGRLLSDELQAPVVCLQSGPLGGDQQIGARIAEGEIDLLIFFWDPLSPHPHDPDVKALLRIAVVWNIPVACDRATADYVISSQLMNEPYERILPNYASHIERLDGVMTHEQIGA
jgi:methylglyoxal synthase